jgi:hypothetical protein
VGGGGLGPGLLCRRIAHRGRHSLAEVLGLFQGVQEDVKEEMQAEPFVGDDPLGDLLTGEPTRPVRKPPLY